MTNLTTRIMAILEQQQIGRENVHEIEPRILGIATTAEKIMEAVGDLGAAPGWNEALEQAAKLFEPSCSCPEPCDDYWIWPSPCAKKAAERIRSLRRPEAAPARPSEEIVRLLREIENRAYSGVNNYEGFSSYRLDLILRDARAVLALVEGK